MSKIGDILEQHIEKIVLGLVGLVCLFLLFFWFFMSPNYVEYDGKKFGAGDIDAYISEQAEVLKDKLNRPPVQPESNLSRAREFSALVQSSIGDIDVSVSPPVPPFILRDVRLDNRAYRIPYVGEVNDIKIQHIGAVAYVPVGEINEQVSYENVEKEPNDLDLVTVEAKIDAAELYRKFYESFAGPSIREEWRDPCLAQPVFASVQLQRQELLKDGSWSDWQVVPRTKIDANRRLFEVIENIEELPPGGIKVRMLQFNRPQLKIDLLQPEAYRFASANEQWFPPSVHDKFLEQRRTEELQAKREAMEQAKEERERELEEKQQERRSRRTDTGRTGDTIGGYGNYGDSEGLYGRSRSARDTRSTRGISSRSDRRTDTGRLADRRTRTRDDRDSDRLRDGTVRETSNKSSMNDVYQEFVNIQITPATDLSKMDKPLVFWAHDDTVEPKKNYRYKIRIGVFNPVAGTNQFVEQDKILKNNVILWSGFSMVTEPVDIPARQYFFASDIQEAAKTVTVDVCKYVLGYWYSERFAVKQGEVIGKVKEVKLKPEEEEKQVTAPQSIDYNIGAVLVDIMPVSDWAGSGKLAPRNYYDMLYSFDGLNIERMPVKARYWVRELQDAFGQIQRLQRQTKEPLRAWESSVGGRIQRGRERDYYGEYRGYEDDY